MLLQRIISAFILIVLVLLNLFYFSPLWFALSWAGVALLAIWEWNGLAEIKNFPTRCLTILIGALIMGYFIYNLDPYLGVNHAIITLNHKILMIDLVWWIVALGLVISFPYTAKIWANSKAVRMLLGFLIIISFFICILELRFLDYGKNNNFGAYLILYVFALIWSADSGAYFVGKKFGKYKLALNISPGKTIEGACGGIVATCIVAYIGGYYLFNTASITLLLIGFAIGLISILGDLLESMFKRQAKIKDSGTLIPGHGGVLDRIDSMLAVMPFFTLCILYIPVYL